MKKTYIIPEALTVVLNSRNSILTASKNLHDDGDGGLSGGLQDDEAIGGGLTKENRDANVWDDEW